MSKQYVRYQGLIIPSKLRLDIRLTIDERGGEYVSSNADISSSNITFFPIIGLTITRKNEIDENGQKIKIPFNPNDTLNMSKFTMPLLANNLKGIQKDLLIIDMYKYQGKRLELNEKLAEEKRRVFMVGNTTLELTIVVIVQEDESRVEGIKMKFNNEQSSVLLTLNELDSLVYTLDHLDVDSIAFLLYINYVNRKDPPKIFNNNNIQPIVDIIPK